MAKKVYPQGQAWPVTDAWKESVRQWLRETGTPRHVLADRVGVDKASITNLLSETRPQYTCRFVPDLCRVTGLAPPTIDYGDEKIKALLEWAYREKARDPEQFTRLLGALLHQAEASAKRERADREHREAMKQLESEISKESSKTPAVKPPKTKH